jgi:hypothetical protein
MAKKASKPNATLANPHKWRLCPAGEHWVSAHALHIPPSKKNPLGSVTNRRSHCAKNPTGKDQLYPDEILAISEKYFSKLKTKPCPHLPKYKKNGSKYDDLIAGWTQYWNEVLTPSVPLDVNTVKALIATESGFDPKILADKKNSNSARGLMQINNQARKILADEKGELKEYYVTATKEQLNDPSINICAGIRWLFRKHEIASILLKRPATWEESIAEFKGVRTTTKARALVLMKKFNQELETLNKCKEP